MAVGFSMSQPLTLVVLFKGLKSAREHFHGGSGIRVGFIIENARTARI